MSQTEHLARRRDNGQDAVSIKALARTITDWTQASGGRVMGEVQERGVADKQDCAVLRSASTGLLTMLLDQGSMSDIILGQQAVSGDEVSTGSELLRQGSRRISSHSGGEPGGARSASFIAQLDLSEVGCSPSISAENVKVLHVLLVSSSNSVETNLPKLV
jgi:hypothetical protein